MAHERHDCSVTRLDVFQFRLLEVSMHSKRAAVDESYQRRSSDGIGALADVQIRNVAVTGSDNLRPVQRVPSPMLFELPRVDFQRC